MTKKRKKIILTIYRLFLVGMIIYGAWGVIRYFQQKDAGKALYNSSIEAAKPSITDPEIRLEALQKTNADIIGWLIVDETGIDFPVLHDKAFRQLYADALKNGGDWTAVRGGSSKTASELFYKYLYNDYTGKPSPMGSVTIDVRVDSAMSGRYVLIYGHNAGIEGIMFSDLERYKDLEYCIRHRSAVLFSESGREDLELIAVSVVSGYDQTVYGLDGLVNDMGFRVHDAVDTLFKNAVYLADRDHIAEDLEGAKPPEAEGDSRPEAGGAAGTAAGSTGGTAGAPPEGAGSPQAAPAGAGNAAPAEPPSPDTDAPDTTAPDWPDDLDDVPTVAEAPGSSGRYVLLSTCYDAPHPEDPARLVLLYKVAEQQ